MGPDKDSFHSIDEYIASFPPEIAAILKRTREVIRAAAPEAVETISYQMPTFRGFRNLVHFAANKSHLGFYPGAEPIKEFAEELKPYKTSKGAIQFPYDEPLPEDLIRQITEFRVHEDNALAAAKKKSNKR